MTAHSSIPLSEKFRPLVPRRMPVADQEARLSELTDIMMRRQLTIDERREQERLEERKYFRLISKTRVPGQRLNAKRGRK